MLSPLFTITLRSLRRFPGYAVTNVVGLAAGLTCCLFIMLFVRHERAHDRWHEQADRTARVAMAFPDGTRPLSPSIVAPLLKREIPEVKETARLLNVGTYQSVVVGSGERMFEESRFFYADSTAFDVFTLPFAAGDPSSALARPRTLVLTPHMAERYFSDENPIGRTLTVDGRDYEVTGVLSAMPGPSHVEFDFLASFSTLEWAQREVWSSANFHTYVLIDERATFASVEARIERLVDAARRAGEIGESHAIMLQPLLSIHLDVDGRRQYVRTFSAVAALILLIACVNYMNLATAWSSRRAKEIGVRKAAGAGRGNLIIQFYSEAAVLTIVSLVVAASAASLLGPLFQRMVGQPIPVDLTDPGVVGAMMLIGVIVTVVAGSYPALRLSSYRPSRALKGTVDEAGRGVTLRRGLVVLQFALTVFLLIGTAAVYGQLRYIQTKDLGFSGRNVIAVPIGDAATLRQLPTLKHHISQLPGVVRVAGIDRLPGGQSASYGLVAEGVQLPPGSNYYPIGGVPSEAGVGEALGLDIIAGSDLTVSENYRPEAGHYVYLINEAVLRATGWTAEEAIGKRMSVAGESHTGVVQGVFRDYHFLPVREPIGPLALFVKPESVNKLLVRIEPGSTAATLGAIADIWREIVPHRPLSYTFLDRAFAAHYARERQIGRLFATFAALAIVIACLGVLGLSAHAAERRRKEIGVRKVLGAPLIAVVGLLSREFAVLVLVGFAIAAPLASWATRRWLSGFAYRADLGMEAFLASGALALVVALATVSYHAVRAATADPVQALRSDQ